MTSGGNNFNYFAENQLTKCSAEMREISVMRNFQGYFSRTFQDLKLQFPGLSRTKVIFQDFPGPGILKKKNSRTFQEAWEPWSLSLTLQLLLTTALHKSATWWQFPEHVDGCRTWQHLEAVTRDIQHYTRWKRKQHDMKWQFTGTKEQIKFQQWDHNTIQYNNSNL